MAPPCAWSHGWARLSLLVAVAMAVVVSAAPSPVPRINITAPQTVLGGTAGDAVEWLASATDTVAPLDVAGGASLTLQNAHIDAMDGLQRAYAAFPAASFTGNLPLPALVHLAPGAALTIRNVVMRVPCSQLRALQDQACQHLGLDELLRLEVLPEDLHVRSLVLIALNTSVADLLITCRDSYSPPTPPSPPPTANDSLTPTQHPVPEALMLDMAERTMSCAVGRGANWTALVAMAYHLQRASTRVHVVVTTNVTVPAEHVGGHVHVANNTTMAFEAHPALTDATLLNLGELNNKACWSLNENATLILRGLTFVTLPLGPPDKYPWSVFGWPMWTVNMERCNNEVRDTQQLVMANCTLVMSADVMDYMSHWTAEVTSPFPDRQEAAAWYSRDATCSPPDTKRFLLRQVKLVDQRQWLAENATGFGVRFVNTLFTSKLPAGVHQQFPQLEITHLFDDPYTPLVNIGWVQTAEDLIMELVNYTKPNIVLLTNVSVPPELWPSGGLEPRDARVVALSGWPSRTTILDLQRAPGAIRLTSTFALRNVLLLNGAQGTTADDSLWRNLTALQWTFRFDRSATLLQMQNVKMVLPTAEFELIMESVKRNQAAGSSGDSSMEESFPGSFWASTQLLSPSAANVDVLVEDGLFAYNVTFLLQGSLDLPFPDLPAAALPTSGVTTNQRDNGRARTLSLALGIALPVTVLLAIAVAVGMYIARRRQGLASGQGDLPWADKPGWRRNWLLRRLQLPSTGQVSSPPDSEEAGLSGQLHAQGPAFCNDDAHDAKLGCIVQHQAAALAGRHPAGVSGTWPQPGLGRAGTCMDAEFLWQVEQPPASGALHDSSRVFAAILAERGGAGSAMPASAPLPTAAAMSAAQLSTSGGGGLTNMLPRSASLAPKSASLPAPAPGDTSYSASHATATSRHPCGSPPPAFALQLAPGGGGGSGVNSHGGSSQLRHSCGTPEPSAGLGRAERLGGTGYLPGMVDMSDYHDSFDMVPEHQEQLLINRMELSRELQASISAPDVASQLKALVLAMQTELGDQEVEVTRVIGQGGGGVVYQGCWRGLTVAVKTLVFTVVPMQPMSRAQHRAMTEAAICKTLQHPNIVATYAYDLHALTAASVGSDVEHGDAGQGPRAGNTSTSRFATTTSKPPLPPGSSRLSRGALGPAATEFKLYIIQEFCDGGTLKDAIDDGKLHDVSTGEARPALAHILQLACDVAAGMAHVHSRNVVHGDLTPANVLLKTVPSTVSGWVAKVADFGLSWKLAQGQAHVSNARQGTSFYIAPEVLHVGIMSKAADVFSFGMLLHEMYHGAPYWRKASSAPDPTPLQLSASRSGVIGLSGLTFHPNCMPEFKHLVCSCLASDPQARPSFFVVVEQLLAMQRQLYAAEEEGAGAGSKAMAGALPDGATSDRDASGHVPFVGGDAGGSGGGGGADGGSWGGRGRHPTSGLLYEGELKARYRSMCLSSSSQQWLPSDGPEPGEWAASLEDKEGGETEDAPPGAQHGTKQQDTQGSCAAAASSGRGFLQDGVGD